MAKKKNGSDFNEFLEQLQQRTSPSLDINAKEERKYFLIVSEGIRTEPIYFEFFSKKLPKNLVHTVKVQGEGDNTVNIVKKAMALRNERKANKLQPDYDEVWAVYDKDDFPAAHFNKAVRVAAQNGIQSAHSNQSFELWYVLHFQYLQSALHRDDYYPILTRHLGIKYAKNTTEVVERLNQIGNVEQAIKWAKKLEDMHAQQTPAQSCPYTRVYELVDRLMKYIENNKSS